MKSIITFFICILTLSINFNLGAEAKPIVIVSVAPHKFFVEKIADNTVKTMIFVPETASPHGYEPPPRQILEASQAAIWFRVGEGFEKKAIEAIKAHRPELVVVDLRKNLPLIPAVHHHHGGACCSADGADLHIWLSLKMAQMEAKTLAETLIQKYPEYQTLYEINLKMFLGELQALDKDFSTLLESVRGKTVMVSHPAYAYFCRDYDLKQLSLEIEGKDPTPKTMSRTLKEAQNLKIKTIFIQPQYTKKGAELVASVIGAKVVELNPYSEHYLDSMKQIAEAFKVGL